jgi:demethylmenaquinone methyltransferase/2-methoxy-6-polyprenyl-1,4-benzoquinol methylase
MNVAQLFSGIARAYDFLNHLFSLNQDRRWRRRLAAQAVPVPQASDASGGAPVSRAPGAAGAEPPHTARVLDLCTGTADLAIELARRLPSAVITGLDFSPAMLEIGREKVRRRKLQQRIRLRHGDVLRLPFEDGSFDLAAMAFGLRNLEAREEGLREACRVLRGGGRLLLLEFAPPADSVPGKLFRWYLRTVIPLIGGWVSGSTSAYRYLFSSIVTFLKPERIEELLAEAGFISFHAIPLSGGIAYLYRAEKGQI